MFLASFSWPPTRARAPQLESIEALRRSMEDDRLVDTFANTHDLVSKVLKALQTHRQEATSRLPEDLKHRLQEDLIPVLETGATQRRTLRRSEPLRPP